MGFSPEVQEILDRVKSGAPKPRAVAKPKSASLYAPPPSKPRYNYNEMVALHKEGLTVAQIAERTGAHRATVARALDAKGVPASERIGGPIRREMCMKGLHSMEDAYEVKGGGRACRHCKKNRAKEKAA